MDLAEIYDRTSQTVHVFHVWPYAGDQKIDWWASDDGQHHAIYRQEAYYDDQLRERRNRGNMICPQNKQQRLVFIGYIVGHIDMAPGTYFEVLRNRFSLTNVAEDEK